MPSSSDKPIDAFQKLEAMLVRSLMGSIIPKQNLGGADQGLADGYWGAIFSDRLANTLSESGQLGIAKTLAESMENKMTGLVHGGAK